MLFDVKRLRIMVVDCILSISQHYHILGKIHIQTCFQSVLNADIDVDLKYEQASCSKSVFQSPATGRPSLSSCETALQGQQFLHFNFLNCTCH